MDERDFLPLGLLSAVIGLGYVVSRVKAGRTVTISLHAAEHVDTYVVFALSLTVAAVCYYLFGFQYLIPATHVSPWFAPLYLLLVTCIFITAWVPDIEGWKRRIHYTVGYIQILPVPVVTLLLALSDVSLVTQIIAGLGTIVAAIILYLFFFVKSSRQHILLIQAMYLLTLNAVLFSAAYL